MAGSYGDEEYRVNLKPVVFQDDKGEEIPGWKIPLAEYLEAHEGHENDWTRAHMVLVARALIHKFEVPKEAVLCHEGEEFDWVMARERKLHSRGQKYCPECGETFEA